MGTEGRVSVGPLYADKHGRYIGVEPRPLVTWWVWCMVGVLVFCFLTLFFPNRQQTDSPPENQAIIAVILMAGERQGAPAELVDIRYWHTEPAGQDRYLVSGIVGFSNLYPGQQFQIRRGVVAQVHIPASAQLEDPQLLSAIEKFTWIVR